MSLFEQAIISDRRVTAKMRGGRCLSVLGRDWTKTGVVLTQGEGIWT